ncbi:Family 2 glycosyl transferase [Candidatus Sulfopaludibacter sp. SbA4]|nr:Family 2 glycosyl transferase [Candidatus Sulfopaludibacter sp. SbA4]
MSAPPLSLLITTRDRRADLLQTLAVMTPCLEPRHEISVFVDGSDDGTAAVVAREFPSITVFEQHPGVGLIAARNRLLNATNAAFALSLDDDAEIVTAGFVPLILEYFASHPRCGVLAFPVFWGRKLPENAAAGSEPIRRVKSFLGGGHVWRMEAWRSIPPYPEWFEMYGEEDFAAMELLRKGWEVHYFPQVLVHHRVETGVGRRPDWRFRYRRQLRSGLFLMFLFYPAAALPRHLASAWWAQIRKRLIQQRDWAAAPVLMRVLLDIVRNLPRLWKLRTGFTSEQWSEWCGLPPMVYYWTPVSETTKLSPKSETSRMDSCL